VRPRRKLDHRNAFLRFRGTENGRTALRMLDRRVGPGGETLDVRLPVMHSSQMWQWVHKVEKSGGGEEGERCLEDDVWEVWVWVWDG
jgi:hypothetical protein